MRFGLACAAGVRSQVVVVVSRYNSTPPSHSSGSVRLKWQRSTIPISCQCETHETVAVVSHSLIPKSDAHRVRHRRMPCCFSTVVQVRSQKPHVLLISQEQYHRRMPVEPRDETCGCGRPTNYCVDVHAHVMQGKTPQSASQCLPCAQCKSPRPLCVQMVRQRDQSLDLGRGLSCDPALGLN